MRAAYINKEAGMGRIMGTADILYETKQKGINKRLNDYLASAEESKKNN